MKWYIKVYGPVDMMVPDYIDPAPQVEQVYDNTELEVRMKALEDLLKKAVEGEPVKPEAVVVLPPPVLREQPGFTPIRTITYKTEQLAIPYFLRDAFLLPQRFDKSEMFLIRLGGEQ